MVGKREDLAKSRGGVFEIYGVLVRRQKKKVAIKISRCPRRGEDPDKTDTDCYCLELTAYELARLIWGGKVTKIRLEKVSKDQRLIAVVLRIDCPRVKVECDLNWVDGEVRNKFVRVRLRKINGARQVYLSQAF